MTREEIYSACETALTKSNVLLLEAATGFGKTWVSIKLVNWITAAVYKYRKPKMLLLVAKRVHKQTWKDEFDKWGGVNADVVMECYESLHKHTSEYFDFIVMDECHHIGSEARMEALRTIKYGYIIGLSATVPLKIKQWFKYHYHAQVVSCDIIEAIDSEVLPEPTILLFPLQIENTRQSETIEINPKVKGPVYHGEYKDLWKYKKAKQHAILKCTQKQKLMELDKLIEWYKKKAMMGNQAMKQTWLYFCGKRLEFLADCKLQWVKLILHHLDKERTITFCKTIAQTEQLGKNCIHSQNKDATKVYDNFNNKKINHITAVNILNENANLVDCKYAIFANLSSSEVVIPQRIGRSMRHKHPVIIFPYYQGTREQEILTKMLEGFNKDFIKIIHSINEI
jgi:superfamily II DNA or RNA helicase